MSDGEEIEMSAEDEKEPVTIGQKVAKADEIVMAELASDLCELEKELRTYGFSISILLRGYAKHFHGISLPILKTAKKDD